MKKQMLNNLNEIKEPNCRSSYKKEDCVMLLKDITEIVTEISTEEKEQLIQSGINYSEVLSKELLPNQEYIDIFLEGVKDMSKEIACYIAYMSEAVVNEHEENIGDLVLVSLARAGTPIGALIKRYIKNKYNIDVPHYSISIIRGKGFDENSINYIYKNHKKPVIQFVDGWTGKGSINLELIKSVDRYFNKYGILINPNIAVIADPAGVSKICGTRKDIFVPNCCLNSTVSGLISRTFESKDITGKYDFHGAKYFEEWEKFDYSNMFLDEISKHFNEINLSQKYVLKHEIINTGIKEVLTIKEEFDIKDINKIKPSIGETTRVLLRRVPKMILVKDMNNNHIKHILYLAQQKNIEVAEYKKMSYEAVGIINDLI